MGALSGKHVLVVEDESLIAMVIEDVVADLGGECAIASNVAAALALIEAQAFDAALLDFNLKGETSASVGERLRELGIPFAYATGYADPAVVTGGAPILAKPYVQADLARALERLIGV